MLFTASTVKDSAANLRRFVTGNLAGGIDHLVVFVDAPEATDPEALEVLESHPSVTCVRTDEEWWQGDRPGQLNTRQRINANLAKARAQPGARGGVGLPHRRRRDRAGRPGGAGERARGRAGGPARPAGGGLPARWDADPTLFKRLLDKDDLTLLHTLGVIDRAHNGAYFHGHVDGKAGVRPTLDLWLTLHHVGRRRQERAGAVAAPGRCGCCTTSPSPARTSCASGPRSSRPGRR